MKFSKSHEEKMADIARKMEEADEVRGEYERLHIRPQVRHGSFGSFGSAGGIGGASSIGRDFKSPWSAFEFEYGLAGGPEERQEVYTKHLNRLVHSYGFKQVDAAKRLNKIINKLKEEESV